MTLPDDKQAADLRPRRGTALLIVSCMCAIYFFAYFQRVSIPGAIFNQLQSSLAISAGAVAAFGALYMYIYGGMQFIAGAMNDRFGAVRVILLGGILLAVGSVLFPLAGSLQLLYASRALVALGDSLIYISIVKALDQLFPARMFPVLLGIAMFVGCAGGLASTLPMERAVHAWGWRPSLLIAGITTAIVVAASGWIFRRTRGVTRHVSTLSLRSIPTILRDRSNLMMFIAAPLNFAVFFLVLTVIGKKFLLDYGRIDSPTASLLTFTMMAMPMLIALINGVFLRMSGGRRRPLMMLSIVLALLSVAALLAGIHFGLSTGWFLFCYILLGLSTLASPISNIIMKELNSSEQLGLAIGIANGVSYLDVALCSTLAGTILDHYRIHAVLTAGAIVYPQQAYTSIFLCCLALLALAFICVLFIRETGKEG